MGQCCSIKETTHQDATLVAAERNCPAECTAKCHHHHCSTEHPPEASRVQVLPRFLVNQLDAALDLGSAFIRDHLKHLRQMAGGKGGVQRHLLSASVQCKGGHMHLSDRTRPAQRGAVAPPQLCNYTTELRTCFHMPCWRWHHYHSAICHIYDACMLTGKRNSTILRLQVS